MSFSAAAADLVIVFYSFLSSMVGSWTWQRNNEWTTTSSRSRASSFLVSIERELEHDVGPEEKETRAGAAVILHACLPVFALAISCLSPREIDRWSSFLVLCPAATACRITTYWASMHANYPFPVYHRGKDYGSNKTTRLRAYLVCG